MFHHSGRLQPKNLPILAWCREFLSYLFFLCDLSVLSLPQSQFGTRQLLFQPVGIHIRPYAAPDSFFLIRVYLTVPCVCSLTAPIAWWGESPALCPPSISSTQLSHCTLECPPSFSYIIRSWSHPHPLSVPLPGPTSPSLPSSKMLLSQPSAHRLSFLQTWSHVFSVLLLNTYSCVPCQVQCWAQNELPGLLSKVDDRGDWRGQMSSQGPDLYPVGREQLLAQIGVWGMGSSGIFLHTR